MRQPDRIVMDTQLRSPPAAKVWKSGARRIALTVQPPVDRIEALRKKGVEVVLVAAREGAVDPASAFNALGRMEINEVLVESGPRLAGALLRAQVIDELVIYTAPSLLGHEARALAQLPGLTALKDRLRFKFVDARMLGADLRITAVPEPR